MLLLHEAHNFLHGFALVQITNFVAMRFPTKRHLFLRALQRRRLVDGLRLDQASLVQSLEF
jgi:hypothetical protein